MISEAMIRASAVGGIVMFWAYFTLNTIKICKEIIFHPKCEHCAEKKEEVVLPKCTEEVVCEECQKPYLDDGECNDCPHLFHDETKHKFLCKFCRKNYN